MLVAVGLAGAALMGCGSEASAEWDEDAPVDAATGSGIEFGDCPALADGATRDPRLTCGTIGVPLDHRDPDGPTIEVAVSKLATSQPDQRRGVLVLNPGGPALPGLDFPGELAASLPPEVLNSYDLIGFDPRGVGRSTPQSCGLTEQGPADLFPYPAADGSIQANIDRGRAIAEQCGDTLKFFTTSNTARDLDLIRQALGEEKISYWGQSYGTYLGTVYESLFPERADRFVLEGNVDPAKVWSESTAGWGQSMADRFPDAARAAVAVGGFGSGEDEVTANYLALADRLDRTPVALPGTSASLNGAALRSITYGLLLDNDKLPLAGQFWAAVARLADGAPTEADTAVLQQILAAGGGATPGVPADNQATMLLALTCGDAEWSQDVEGAKAEVDADRAAFPLTAGMPVNVWPCAFWADPVEAPVTVTDDGPRNTLILQNRRDHATPWKDGVALRETLGDRAAFVGVENGGHYVWASGSACADQATVTFLTEGELPDEDLYCTDVTQS